jgi:hypothetical protein
MNLTGLHLLLSYQCNFECDHCFVWGSPWQSGTMTGETVQRILAQAQELGTIEWIYFEGGEPFLYYPILLQGVHAAAELGFKVGLVSNAYWGTCEQDALAWLEPFAGLIQDLSVSSDLYHYSETMSREAENARRAAEHLEIPVGVICVAQPEVSDAGSTRGQLSLGESGVMYRGRAATKLAGGVEGQPWSVYTECPYEDLADPGRVHVDPLGHVHICQGISLGSMLHTPLTEICARYDPAAHPITGPLLESGPVELVERYELPHAERYADACHLCDAARRGLRDRFPEILTPDQMYAVSEST